MTAQKMKFSIKNFCSEYGQIRSLLRIWLHLLKKSLMEILIFCAVHVVAWNGIYYHFTTNFTKGLSIRHVRKILRKTRYAHMCILHSNYL